MESNLLIFKKINNGDKMENIYEKLVKNENPKTNEILDACIAFQIKKMVKHNKQRLLSESSEQAMENLIKLLEMRYTNKGA